MLDFDERRPMPFTRLIAAAAVLAAALAACSDTVGPKFPQPDPSDPADTTELPGLAFEIRATRPLASGAPFHGVDHDGPFHVPRPYAGQLGLRGGARHVFEPRRHVRT